MLVLTEVDQLFGDYAKVLTGYAGTVPSATF
jgi:hypothetical protein